MTQTNDSEKEVSSRAMVKRKTPPYLSVGALDELVKLASNRNMSEVSTALFKGYQFTSADAVLAVGALKFLGLADENGKATELMAKLRLQGEAGKQELQKIIRNAYKELFEATDAPQNLSTEELSNEMVVKYDLSRRVARTAVPVFIRLCELAGLKEEAPKSEKAKAGTTSKPKTEHKTKKDSHKEVHPTTRFGYTDIEVAKGKVVISINPQLFLDKDFRQNWNTFMDAADTLAESIKDEPLDQENKDEGG